MIIAAARSGARTAYVTRVGDDEFGRLFLDLWKGEGVDTSGVIVDREAPTGAYFVTHGAQGHVFSYLRAGSAASAAFTPAELVLSKLPLSCTPRASAMAISRDRRRHGAGRLPAALRKGKDRVRFQPAPQALAARACARNDRRGGGDGGLFLSEHRRRAGAELLRRTVNRTWNGPTRSARRRCSSSSAPTA